MARFLKDKDYAALIRDEIKDILLENYSESKLHQAENMAIAQIKNHMASRYDMNLAFQSSEDESTDTRNSYIVMITIDCTLYHLYSSLAPNKIPEHRANRYDDAISWLKDIRRGDAEADIPRLTDSNGQTRIGIIITSEYPNEDNRW